MRGWKLDRITAAPQGKELYRCSVRQGSTELSAHLPKPVELLPVSDLLPSSKQELLILSQENLSAERTV